MKKCRCWFESLRSTSGLDEEMKSELDDALRLPPSQTDEVLCERIIEAVRVADQPRSQLRTFRPVNWAMFMTGATTVVAALVVILFWMQPWASKTNDPNGIQRTISVESPAGGDPGSEEGGQNTSVQREQAHLKADTQQIASFLRQNLHL